MRIIIAGSRRFNNYKLLSKTLNKYLGDVTEIVCGGAVGADTLGEKWALEHNIPVRYFFPEWNRFGKSAGVIRNHQMGDYADFLVAFWDGQSRGTKDMISYMSNIGKHGEVVMFKEGEE